MIYPVGGEGQLMHRGLQPGELEQGIFCSYLNPKLVYQYVNSPYIIYTK